MDELLYRNGSDAHGHRGDLPQEAHQHPGAGQQDLPVPARKPRHQAAQPGLGCGHYLPAVGQGCAHQHGQQRPLGGQRIRRAAVAKRQIRKPLPAQRILASRVLLKRVSDGLAILPFISLLYRAGRFRGQARDISTASPKLRRIILLTFIQG